MSDIATLLPPLDHCSGVKIDYPEHNYPVLHIKNAHASAKIALHGAHVLTFIPHHSNNLIWLSNTAVYKEGVAIRGGIPICWPWFGPHPTNPALPSHGFARNRFWTLSRCRETESSTELSFTLEDSPDTLAIWPHAFSLRLDVSVGRTLEVSLHALNTGTETAVVGGALHTYLAIEDIGHVEIQGLENCEYIDKLEHESHCIQKGAIQINSEIDRVYTSTQGDIRVVDKRGGREILVGKGGSATTVVWNPWIEKSSKMEDFETDGYRRMVCIEAANAGSDVTALKPGCRHVLKTSLVPLPQG